MREIYKIWKDRKRRKTTVKSFAIWYNEKTGSRAESIDLAFHLNLLSIKKTKINYLDVGLLIDGLDNIESIKLFVPVHKDNLHVEDLIGKIAKKNDKLLNAIFNEDFAITYGGRAKKTLINTANANGRGDFYLYELSSEQIILREIEGGTIVEINLENVSIEKIKDYYFRFRLKITGQVEFIKDHIDDLGVFDSAFNNVEIIDFRLNDIRSLDNNIKENFENGKKFNLKKIHYLILREAQDEVIYFGEMKSRILESELWGPYFSGSINCKQDIIAYHIKKLGNNIESFTNLIRFKYKKTKPKKLVTYFIYIVAVGVVTNFISNYLWNKLFEVRGV